MTHTRSTPRDKRFGALFVATITATGAIGVSAAIPGAIDAELELGLPNGRGAAIVGTFATGYAFGHIVVGLITSEASKRRVLIAGLLGFVLTSLLIGIAADSTTLSWLRASQGFCASVCPIIGRALVRELGTDRFAAKRMSSATAIFAWAPVIAPVAAAWLGTLYGWRSVYFALAAYAGVSLVWVLNTSRADFASPSAREEEAPALSERIGEVLRSSTSRAGIATGTFAFAGFFAFLASAADLSTRWSDESISLSLAVAAVSAGYALGAGGSRIALRSVSAQSVLRSSLALMLGVSAILGATIASGAELPVIIACAALYAFCAGAAMPNATMSAMAPSPHSAAFAVALLGMTKTLVASAVSWMAVWWPSEPTGYLGAIMFAGAASALLCVLLTQPISLKADR